MSQQINLFNPAFARPRQILSAQSMLQMLGILVTVVLLVAALATWLFSDLEKQALDAAAGRESAAAQLLKVRKEDAAGARNRALDDDIRVASSDIRSMQHLIEVLRKEPTGDTTGFASYLQAFARHGVDGVWLTGFSIAGAGHEMTLQGRALQPELVAAYLANLKGAPVLKGVTFSALEIASRPGAGYVEFDLRSAAVTRERPDSPPASLAPLPRTSISASISNSTGAKP